MKSRFPFFLLAIAVACLVVPSIPRRIRAQTSQARQLQQTAPVSSWPSKAKRWALVIGVDQYADPQISPLTQTGPPPQTVYRVARKAGGPLLVTVPLRYAR